MAQTTTAMRESRSRWWEYCPKAGMRLSIADAAYLAAAIVFAIFMEKVIGNVALLPLVALAHFFLFCNVFRIHRRLELIWTGVFILNFALWSLTGPIEWMKILAVQTPVTIVLIGYEIMQPRYHGIGAKRNHAD